MTNCSSGSFPTWSTVLDGISNKKDFLPLRCPLPLLEEQAGQGLFIGPGFAKRRRSELERWVPRDGLGSLLGILWLRRSQLLVAHCLLLRVETCFCRGEEIVAISDALQRCSWAHGLGLVYSDAPGRICCSHSILGLNIKIKFSLYCTWSLSSKASFSITM